MHSPSEKAKPPESAAEAADPPAAPVTSEAAAHAASPLHSDQTRAARPSDDQLAAESEVQAVMKTMLNAAALQRGLSGQHRLTALPTGARILRNNAVYPHTELEELQAVGDAKYEELRPMHKAWKRRPNGRLTME